MKRVVSRFMLAAVCTIASSLACNGELNLADNYLNIFYKINPANDDLNQGHFFDMLNGLTLTHESNPESVLHQLEKLEKGQSNEFAEKCVKDLINLASDDAHCSKSMLSTFYRAVRVLASSEVIGSRQVLLAYLDHFGPRKFERCVPNAIKYLRNLLHWKNLYGLKEPKILFKQMVYLERNVKIDQLYDKLKVFHPTVDNMNVEGLASIWDDNEKEKTAFERIDKKFYESCNFIIRDSRQYLDIVNLASSLNSNKNYFELDDVELRNLNEMNRICIERKRNFVEFLGNLRGQTIEWLQHRSLDLIGDLDSFSNYTMKKENRDVRSSR